MQRYFIEVIYKGTNYSGFQVQENANSIQREIEKVFATLLKCQIELTGSSRTDAGVHALQNFFHADVKHPLRKKMLYQLNAILPADIVIKNMYRVAPNAHCRFAATSREYKYFIYQHKNPFLQGIAHFYPYALNMQKMNEAAAILKNYTDFTSFSKRNTQAKTFNCTLFESEWLQQDEKLVYNVKGNRFLRGMVRGLTATMLKVGREKLSLTAFKNILEAKDCTKADFSVPAHGLFLVEVEYPSALLASPVV
jgi:tRNA pseudouridine38-40 synthase